MKNKWIKLVFLCSFLAMMIYIIGIFLFSEILPSWRYNRDKKDTIENFRKQETTFEKIRNTSIELPDFDLQFDGEKTLLIFDLNETDTLELDYWQPSFSPGPIDTFINKIKWSIQIYHVKNDKVREEYLSLFQKEILKFEDLRKWGKKIGCDRILNKEKEWLHLVYKYRNDIDKFAVGFRYVSFYENPIVFFEQNEFIGNSLNDNFFWEKFDESMICSFYPYWTVPNSEFEH